MKADDAQTINKYEKFENMKNSYWKRKGMQNMHRNSLALHNKCTEKVDNSEKKKKKIFESR